MADGKVTIETVLDSREFNKALDKLSGTAKSGLKATTAAIASAATALGGLGLMAVKSGISFESAFAGVKKTVDATDEELLKFKQGIRDMAKEMPQSAEAIAGVAEAAGQLGIKNKNLMSFTKTMTMLGDATNMSSDEAATSLARLANITGMSQDNFDRLGSTVVALGNNLATTESEIVAMSMRIAGAGHQVGLTEAQIMSFSGALSSVGIEAEAGGSAFSNLISKMSLATQKGGVELEQFANVAGMSAAEFKEAFEKDAATAIITFIKGLDKINKNGGSAIKVLDEMGLSDIRMRDALLRAAGASDVFTDALKIGSDAWNQNTALTKEAEQRYKTLESRIGIFKNTLNDIGISIYESVNTPLGDMVTAATDAANELSKAFEKDGIQGLAKGLGNVLADAATEVAKNAPALISAGAQTVKAFIKGLYNHRGEIVKAAGDVAIALGEGIASMLPKGLGNAFKNVSKVVVTAAKPLLKIADVMLKVAATGANLTPVILGVIGAFKLSSFIDKFVAALKLVSLGQTANTTSTIANTVATKANMVATKANSAVKTFAAARDAALATATAGGTTATIANTAAIQAQGIAAGVSAVATKALGAAMTFLGGPVGVAIAAVGALVGIVAVLGTQSEDTGSKYRKAAEEIAEANDKKWQSFKESQKAAKEQAEADAAQIDHVKKLKAELDTLVDSNGRVKEGYEARAKFILNELNKATGLELELQDGVIQKYKEQSSAIDELMEKKRAEAILSANEEGYKKAIANQQAYRDELEKSIMALDEHMQKEAEAKSAGEGAAASWEINKKRLADAVEKASKRVQDNDNAIIQYESMLTEFERGNYDALNSIISGHADNVSRINSMKLEDLQKNKTETETVLDGLKKVQQDHDTKTVQEAIAAKEKELGVIDEKLAGMAEKTKSGGDNVAREAGKASDKALSAARRNRASWKDVGKAMMDGLVNGITFGAKSVYDAVIGVGETAYNFIRKHLKINSPSRIFRDGVGKSIPEGMSVGINESASLVEEAALESVDRAFKSVSKSTSNFEKALNNMDIPKINSEFRMAVESQMSKPSSYVPTQLYKSAEQTQPQQIVNQTININEPVKTPYETARALRKEAINLGLAGA